MITKKQATEEDSFHAGNCERHEGPRGGITEKSEQWRRNGQTKLWKTRPNEFRVPVKYGLYGYGYIDQNDDSVHTATDCPLNDSEFRS